MLNAILNYLTDSSKLIATSVGGIFVSTTPLSQANTALQHGAWFVAIVAGILTIINLFFPLRSFYEQRRRTKLSRRKK